LEQEKLKAQLAWRQITPDLASALKAAISNETGSVDIRYIDSDPESLYFATQFRDLFGASSNWHVGFGNIKFANLPVFGLDIPGPDTGNVMALRRIFSKANFTFDTTDLPPQIMVGLVLSLVGGPTLVVGSKPPAIYR
jgi:hypothetical protein